MPDLLISEHIIIFMALATVVACVLAWLVADDYEAIGYGLLALSVMLVYIWIDASQPPDIERRVLVRLTWAGALLVIIVWRAVAIAHAYLSSRGRR